MMTRRDYFFIKIFPVTLFFFDGFFVFFFGKIVLKEVRILRYLQKNILIPKLQNKAVLNYPP